MKEFDYLALDGRSLRLFLTVLETGSVTAAAERLGLTQSAVSHALDKLRAITGDPLFVKSGRGIVATGYAKSLQAGVREVLDGMRDIARPPAFDPAGTQREFTIAANDYQRDLLLPHVLRTLCREAPGVRLRVIPAGIPEPNLLREDRCDLVVTPQAPAGSDIVAERLFEDRLVCFYDPAETSPPVSMPEYLAHRHIGIQFDESEKADFEKVFRSAGIHRRVAVVVNNVAGVGAFMRGTKLLAILPSLLQKGLMREFACCAPPFDLEPLPVYQVWHRRHEQDGAHRWLRQQLHRATAAVTEPTTGRGRLANYLQSDQRAANSSQETR